MSDLDGYLPAIAAGDPDAFGRWVAGAESRLRGSLRRFAERVDVEAVLQETLLRTWQVTPRHEPDGRPDSLLRLAIRIGRNLAIDEVRRNRYHLTDDDTLETLVTASDERPGWRGPDPLLRQAIRECRSALIGRPAAALEARLRSQGMVADEDLATGLGMKLNTFLQNVTRARKALAACLEKAGVDLAEAWR